MSQPALRNDTITGLRGLLAFSVVLFHVYSGSVVDNILKADYVPRISVMVGPMAVYLFFVISGYLITRSLMRHGNVRRFAIDRMLRIYPVFLVIHMLIFSAGPVIGYSWLADLSLTDYIIHFFSNLLFLPGIFNLPIAQFVAWSLSYEAAFYLIMGLGYYMISRRGWRYMLAPIPLAASFYLISLDPAFLFFAAGILLSIGKFSSTVPIFTRLDGFIALTLACVLFDPDFIYWSLLCALIFFHTVARQHGYASRILRTKPFMYLGTISYSLYLWHTVVMFPIKRIVIAFNFPEWIGVTVFGIASIIGSLVVSHCSYQWIEVKITKFLKNKIRTFTEKNVPPYVQEERKAYTTHHAPPS